MEEKYKDWINANVPTQEVAYGACLTFTWAMQEYFSELTSVYGNYYCPTWGKRWQFNIRRSLIASR